MDRVSGMHEHSRGARGIERCHDFLGNDGTLTNTGDHHAPFKFEEQGADGLKGCAELRNDPSDRFAFKSQGVRCTLNPIHGCGAVLQNCQKVNVEGSPKLPIFNKRKANAFRPASAGTKSLIDEYDRNDAYEGAQAFLWIR